MPAAKGRDGNTGELAPFERATLDAEARASFELALGRPMEWVTKGLVVPHLGRTIGSAVDEINA